MRVLLTSGPVYSHLVPMMLPIASALQTSGHEVAVATSTMLADELHRSRLRHLPLPRMLAPSQMASDPDYARRVGLSEDGVPLPELGTMESGAAFGRLFAGLTATRAAEDMLAVASAFRPDLVVRECTELGGYLFAERLDLPCITLDIAPLVPTRHQGMLPWLNESRATLKLPPVDDTSGLNGCGWVSWLPEPWYPDDLRSRALRYYRSDCGPAQQLDPVIARLPSDRPFVLATLGSNTWATPRESLPFRQIVEALGALRMHCSGGAGSRRRSGRVDRATTRQRAPGVVCPTTPAPARLRPIRHPRWIWWDPRGAFGRSADGRDPAWSGTAGERTADVGAGVRDWPQARERRHRNIDRGVSARAGRPCVPQGGTRLSAPDPRPAGHRPARRRPGEADRQSPPPPGETTPSVVAADSASRNGDANQKHYGVRTFEEPSPFIRLMHGYAQISIPLSIRIAAIQKEFTHANTTSPAPATTSTGAELPLLAIPQKRLLTVNESGIPVIRDTVAPGIHIQVLRLDLEHNEWVCL